VRSTLALVQLMITGGFSPLISARYPGI
jgi:hypothetical protein